MLDSIDKAIVKRILELRNAKATFTLSDLANVAQITQWTRKYDEGHVVMIEMPQTKPL